jgi:hypothetical protein
MTLERKNVSICMSVLEPLVEEGLASATVRHVTLFFSSFHGRSQFFAGFGNDFGITAGFSFSRRMIGVFVIWNMSFMGNTCIELSMT